MEHPPVITYIVAAIALIVVAVGGVVVITDPKTLSFDAYCDTLVKLAAAVGITGVARAYVAGKKTEASTNVTNVRERRYDE